jgi:hypothetical protein
MALPTLGNFIDGRQVAAASDSLELVSPVTEETYASAADSGSEEVDRAFRAAKTAFAGWSESTPAERQLALFRIADAIEARADEFAALESRDTGKPLATLVQDEILVSVDQIRFFAGAARVLEGRAAGEYLKDHTSFVRREPVGVIGQVTPWNYPLNMATWKFAPAIAAGNTVVLKPSETTPSSTLLLAEVAAEFLPPGVLNVVTGGRETGARMIEHPIPAMVSITGSVRAGMAVARSAASDLKRVHLELGGKAPVIVYDDADVALAVEGIVTAGYFNAGQDCTAATRLLVQDGIHDEFVAALTEYAREHATTGAPDEDVLFGPLNNRRGAGPDLGERRRIRPVVLGVDARPRPRDAGGEAPRLRLRVDQHAHPAGRRDAARRVQALRLRQGSLDVRLRGLHSRQARDVVHRGLIGRRPPAAVPGSSRGRVARPGDGRSRARTVPADPARRSGGTTRAWRARTTHPNPSLPARNGGCS